jgi:hypothetical protein
MGFYISSSISLHSHYCLKGLKGTSAGKSLWFRMFNMWILFCRWNYWGWLHHLTMEWAKRRTVWFQPRWSTWRWDLNGSRWIQLIPPWCLTRWCPNVPNWNIHETERSCVVRGIENGTPFSQGCNWHEFEMWLCQVNYMKIPKVSKGNRISSNFISHYLSILKHPKQQQFLYWFIYHVYTHLCISIQIIYVSIHIYISIDVWIHQKKSMIFHRCSPRGSIWACNWKLQAPKVDLENSWSTRARRNTGHLNGTFKAPVFCVNINMSIVLVLIVVGKCW